MKKLIYPAILWLICLLLQADPFTLRSLSAMLLSVSLTAIGLCLSPKPCTLLCLFYAAAIVLWPPLLLFLPLCAYLLRTCDLSAYAPSQSGSPSSNMNPRSFFWLIPLLICLPAPLTLLTVAALCLLAMLLAYNSHAIELQEHRFYALQDDAIQKERSLEEKNRTLLEKQDYQIQLATLTERGRLAREIHDNVGHLLTRALFQVSALEVMQPENKEALGMVKTTLEDAMTNIRASVHDLHDEALDLRLELQKLIDQFPACPVTLRYTCQPVPPPIHYCFIAVVKEALSNIARHSNATSATVSVLEHPALYQLIIEDNGSPSKLITQSTSSAEKDSSAGFFGSSHSRTTGIGLHNIQERVTALQGNMIIQTDRGFRIFISIPKNEQEVSQ